MNNIIYLIPFYILGAFPSGRLLGTIYGERVSQHGSGNIGATNVARVLGWRAGFTTLLLDLSKGLLAAWIGNTFWPEQLLGSLCGLAAVLGHCFSIPGYFKGGKGVATSLGVFIFFSPQSALLGILVFIFVYMQKKIVSLSSVIAAFVIPLSIMFLREEEFIFKVSFLISALVIFRHKENLTRLVRGEESMFKAGRD